MIQLQEKRPVIGWREWVALPQLGLDHVKAKVDTGARTSTLHAFFVESYRSGGKDWVRFGVHPYQRDTVTKRECIAEVLDERMVADSGGNREKRYVIESEAEIGNMKFLIEITLSNRDTMMFRMLLGRTALHRRFIVDPDRSYLIGKRPKKKKR